MSVCPRCGLEYNWLERRKGKNNVYIYAVHYEGKRNVRKCYLGAEKYKYIEHFYNLGLTNSLELDYLQTALFSLQNFYDYLVEIGRMEDEKIRRKEIRKVKERWFRVNQITEILDRIQSKFEELEKRLEEI